MRDKKSNNGRYKEMRVGKIWKKKKNYIAMVEKEWEIGMRRRMEEINKVKMGEIKKIKMGRR